MRLGIGEQLETVGVDVFVAPWYSTSPVTVTRRIIMQKARRHIVRCSDRSSFLRHENVKVISEEEFKSRWEKKQKDNSVVLTERLSRMP